MILFEKGREGILDASIDYDTDTVKVALVDLNDADTGVKAITGATNATPIVITATSHGFSNNDLVYIQGVAGNLAANGIWKIANVAANTFELKDPIEDTNAVGSGAYTSGGIVVNLTLADNLDDIDAGVVGTAQTLASKTKTLGVADAADVTFTAVTGDPCEGVIMYKDTGTPSTSRLIGIETGYHVVTVCKAALATDTALPVERLRFGIPNGTVLTFSDGTSATLTTAGAVGDRSLAVSALAANIAIKSRALAPATGAGLPVTPSGGDITIQWNAAGIFKI